MLKYRMIFGPLMIAMCVFCFWADMRLDHVSLDGLGSELFLGRSYLPAGLLLAAVTIGLLIPLAARELRNMLQASGVAAHGWLITTMSMLACLAVYATPRLLNAPMGATIIASVLVVAFVGTLLWHSRHSQTQGAIGAAGATMFAVVLLGLMPGFYLGLRRWHSAWVVMAVLLTVKSCDIGAYFTGRFLGRHKMIPWLSPKKTWEGLIGGVAFASLVAVGFAWLSHHTELAWTWRSVDMTGGGDEVRQLVPQIYHLGWAAVAGALFALVGQCGDLMISLFKRDVGMKDSGSSIPGFGGVLDVFDSPLLVAPVAYWMLELAVRVDWDLSTIGS